MTELKKDIADFVKAKAEQLGFVACGIAKADFLEGDKARLRRWLDGEMHGEMHYMENHFDKRLDPRLLIDNAKSIVSVLYNYYPSQIQNEDAPQISKYAYGQDYHFVLKEKMNQLLALIQREFGEVNGRAFVDSAPVLEKSWAQKAGLGWIGKNSNLISKEHGSFVFIGELIIDLEIEYDQPFEKDYCGSCTKCIDNCPTGALVEPRVIDARKCISYLTIEYRGDLPEGVEDKMQNQVYGCDICQNVCPWNVKVNSHNEPLFEPQLKLLSMTNEEWKGMSKETFNELFRKSAVKRTKYEGLMRNLAFLKGDKA